MKKCVVLSILFAMGLIQPVFAEHIYDEADQAPAPIEDLSRAAPLAASQADAQSSEPGQQIQPAQDEPVQSEAARNEQPLTQTSADGTPQQRVGRLELQVQNFTQMDLPSKIEALQKQLQAFRGELEMQAREIKKLDAQQKKFYEDIDRRIVELGAKKELNENKAPEANAPSSDAAAPSTSADDAVVLPPASAADTVTSAQQRQVETKLYRTALQSLAQQDYKAAITGLKRYLKTYPKGEYCANAYYWMGQTFYVQGELKQASWQFKTLIDTFPKSKQVPDAALKLAFIHKALGQPALARKEFSRILVRYPNSKAANIARQKVTARGKSVK